LGPHPSNRFGSGRRLRRVGIANKLFLTGRKCYKDTEPWRAPSRRGERPTLCTPAHSQHFLMAQQNSFDIVSQVEMAEVKNALDQAMKEVRQRFDFKGSHAEVRLEGEELILNAEDETKLRNMNEILQQKLVRRGVPLKALDYGRVEPAAGGTVRQHVGIQQGIPTDQAKEIVKFIKETKLKVQAAIQGDVVRITGRDRDTLQDVIAQLKAKDFGINMQYTNYRSN
jgi:cyclic-di-GMP-binding protein